MSAGAYQIATTRYNRKMQNIPRDRIRNRDKVWLNYLKGKVSYSSEIMDTKSSSERRAIRRRLYESLIKDKCIAFGGVLLTGILLVWLAMFFI